MDLEHVNGSGKLLPFAGKPCEYPLVVWVQVRFVSLARQSRILQYLRAFRILESIARAAIVYSASAGELILGLLCFTRVVDVERGGV